MKLADQTLESLNLDPLAHGPARCRVLTQMLWPKIQPLLARGHTIREIHSSLAGNGIEVSYWTFCRCIARLRQGQPARGEVNLAPAQSAAVQTAADPWDNVRRVTERQRPGFHYPGTLSDEELFGKK